MISVHQGSPISQPNLRRSDAGILVSASRYYGPGIDVASGFKGLGAASITCLPTNLTERGLAHDLISTFHIRVSTGEGPSRQVTFSKLRRV